MKVYVVMANDYPDSVYTTKAVAAAFVAKQSAKEAALARSVKQWRPRIYWNFYEFDLKETADA